MDSFKMLPSNKEAECSILSTILVNPESIGDSVSYITPQDFYDGRNMVFIDYIGLIESSGRFENRQQEISKISGGVKKPCNGA